MSDADSNAQLEQIAELLRRQTGITAIKSSEYDKDIASFGIAGADTAEFLEAFAKQFSVDMSCFRYGDYIENEGLDIVNFVRRLFFGKKFLPITIRDLANIAKTGRWPQTAL